MLLFQHLLIVCKALGVRPCDSGLLTTYLHHAGVAASAYGDPPGSVDGLTCSTGCPLRGYTVSAHVYLLILPEKTWPRLIRDILQGARKLGMAHPI